MQTKGLTTLLGATAYAALMSHAFGAGTPVQQSGNVTFGHGASWSAPGIIQDAGTSDSSAITTLGVTANGGLPLCVNNTNVHTGPYYKFCLSTDSSGNSIIHVNGYNGASAGTLSYEINGTLYPFPGSGSGDVVGPSTSTINGVTCFGSAVGTLIKDCPGKFLLNGSSSGAVTVAAQANAGTYNFNLPTTSGTAGQALISGGGGSTAMSWTSVPTTLKTLSDLSALTATQMALYNWVILSSGFSGSISRGGSIYLWYNSTDASGLTPDGTTIIAPSDHPGVCTSGCMVRQISAFGVQDPGLDFTSDPGTEDNGTFGVFVNGGALCNMNNIYPTCGSAPEPGSSRSVVVSSVNIPSTSIYQNVNGYAAYMTTAEPLTDGGGAVGYFSIVTPSVDESATWGINTLSTLLPPQNPLYAHMVGYEADVDNLTGIDWEIPNPTIYGPSLIDGIDIFGSGNVGGFGLRVAGSSDDGFQIGAIIQNPHTYNLFLTNTNPGVIMIQLEPNSDAGNQPEILSTNAAVSATTWEIMNNGNAFFTNIFGMSEAGTSFGSTTNGGAGLDAGLQVFSTPSSLTKLLVNGNTFLQGDASGNVAITASANLSVNGSNGITGSTCTAWTKGLCTSP